MKKIFTLIAVAAMAINANAQEKYVVSNAEGKAPVADESVQASASVKLTYGNDTFEYKENGEVTGFTAYVVGKNNPKDASDAGYSADNKKLPTKGCYYILETTKGGTFVWGVQLNQDKEFYVTDAEGNCLNETINAKFVQDDKTALTPTTGAKGGLVLAEKLKGFITFTIPAAGKYYVFNTGGKLGFYGFEFTAAGGDGIASVKAAKANAAEYNLAGQKVAAGFKGLVIKNGKKVIK